MRIALPLRPSPLVLLAVLLAVGAAPAPAAAVTCNQAAIEGSGSIPATLAYRFEPRSRVLPFYQWLNNNGYCGEVSLIEAGLANGQWISQYNARSIATPFTAYTQTGQRTGISFYSQMLLDDFASPTTTSAVSYGKAAGHLKLKATAYPSAQQATGQAGYENFMLWIRARIVAGDQVTLGVVDTFDNSPPYSHIVNVQRIESKYAGTNTTYHADDVLYVEDHGLVTYGGSNPAVPPGTTSTSDCTPFVFGYSFAKWSSAVGSAKIYGFLLPRSGAKNYAYAVSGVQDTQGVTLPVRVGLSGNGGAMNTIAGWNYESPMIGTSTSGGSVTNTAPTAATLTLSATVSGLTAGRFYNLYVYRFTARPLLGPLPVPTANFNANANLASQKLTFLASATTYTATLNVPSSATVVFRAVAASAP